MRTPPILTLTCSDWVSFLFSQTSEIASLKPLLPNVSPSLQPLQMYAGRHLSWCLGSLATAHFSPQKRQFGLLRSFCSLWFAHKIFSDRTSCFFHAKLSRLLFCGSTYRHICDEQEHFRHYLLSFAVVQAQLM